MTDPAPQTQSRPAERGAKAPRNRRPGPGVALSGTFALFAVTFGFLTYQLRTGHDPALGAQALASTATARPVVVKRVIKRRIITRVVPTPGATGTTVATSSAPVTTSSAPVASSAAPAPVMTSAS